MPPLPASGNRRATGRRRQTAPGPHHGTERSMAQETGTPGKGRRICRIRLSDGGRAERRQLEDSGAAAYRRRRARILPLADGARDDGGRTGSGIAPVLEAGVPAAGRVRRRCAGEGLEAALVRREQGNRKRRSLDGGGEAKLVALACPQPPEGRSGGRCSCWRTGLAGWRSSTRSRTGPSRPPRASRREFTWWRAWRRHHDCPQALVCRPNDQTQFVLVKEAILRETARQFLALVADNRHTVAAAVHDVSATEASGCGTVRQ